MNTMDEMDKMRLGICVLKRLKNDSGLTWQEIAARAGVSASLMSSLSTGLRLLNAKNIEKIMRGFGLDLHVFYGIFLEELQKRYDTLLESAGIQDSSKNDFKDLLLNAEKGDSIYVLMSETPEEFENTSDEFVTTVQHALQEGATITYVLTELEWPNEQPVACYLSRGVEMRAKFSIWKAQLVSKLKSVDAEKISMTLMSTTQVSTVCAPFARYTVVCSASGRLIGWVEIKVGKIRSEIALTLDETGIVTLMDFCTLKR